MSYEREEHGVGLDEDLDAISDVAPADPNRLNDPDYVPGPAPAGQIWVWENGGWVLKAAPTATTTTNTNGGGGQIFGPEDDERDGLVGGYYDANGKWVRGSPRSTMGGGGGGEIGAYSFEGNWPSYLGPSYVAPPFDDPGLFDPGPAFSYQDFVAPDPNNITNDKSFQFRLDQGRKALEASAAGRGTLRSGGTMKDLMEYGQNFASQEYGNIWNRALQEYDTNRSNAFDNWNTGYMGRKDAYNSKVGRSNSLNDFNVNNAQFGFSADQNNAQFGFNAQQRQREYELDDAFKRWAAEGGWLTDLSVAGLSE